VNSITGSVEAFEEVDCSECGKVLGLWSDLVAATNQTTGEAHEDALTVEDTSLERGTGKTRSFTTQ
tara:strand:- start:707 stop:904 length:198 start_codon:yes stop_codon:yes gene_type:complete